jgi:hypothetical protein
MAPWTPALRRQLLADLGTGRLSILTSCSLIGEGVDVPSVGGCILLRPTASVGLAPANDWSLPEATTWQDCGGAGSCWQHACGLATT